MDKTTELTPSIYQGHKKQAIIATCDVLDAIPPINRAVAPVLPPIHAGAELDSGFDIDTAGLTSTIHEDLVDVSTLHPKSCRSKHTLTLYSHAQIREKG